MNLGKGRWHSKYICDKCHEEIPYIEQKGFVGINHYSRATYRNPVYKKSFDLCQNCEKKFRKWLKDRELPTVADTINKFQIYKAGGKKRWFIKAMNY